MFELPIEYQSVLEWFIKYGISTKFMTGSRRFEWLLYKLPSINVEIETRHSRLDNSHQLEIIGSDFMILGESDYKVVPTRRFYNPYVEQTIWNGKPTNLSVYISKYFTMFSSSYSDNKSYRVNLEVAYYGNLEEIRSIATLLYMQESF